MKIQDAATIAQGILLMLHWQTLTKPDAEGKRIKVTFDECLEKGAEAIALIWLHFSPHSPGPKAAEAQAKKVA